MVPRHDQHPLQLAAWRHPGFRDRGHRLHSGGDYHHPPPPGEHAGLHRWAQRRSSPIVRIPPELRPPVGEAIFAKADAQGHVIVACCVGAVHGHMLVKLPGPPALVRRLVGSWKQAASHAVRRSLPGRLWSEGCHAEPVRSAEHRAAVHPYILDHRREGAWICSRCEDIWALPW